MRSLVQIQSPRPFLSVFNQVGESGGMADALDLGSSGLYPWGFKSPLSHHPLSRPSVPLQRKARRLFFARHDCHRYRRSRRNGMLSPTKKQTAPCSHIDSHTALHGHSQRCWQELEQRVLDDE